MTALTLSVPASARPARAATAVLRGLGHVLLGVTALAAVAGAVLVVVLKLGFSPVLSASMSPSFDAGDLIITKPLAASQIAVGDVIVLPVPDAPGQRYVHRVTKVAVGPSGLPVVNTKGDNNADADPWTLSITSAQVPSVVADVPAAGRLALHTSGAALRIPLLLLVAGGVLVAVKRSLLDR